MREIQPGPHEAVERALAADAWWRHVLALAAAPE